MVISTTSATRLLCVIGHPVGHSLSPPMQSAAIAKSGLDLAYLAFDVAPESLGPAIGAMRPLGILGMNVTIPHKVEAMRFLDRIDPLARKIGAVNAIHNARGSLVGYNTDGYGALAALREAGVAVKGKKAVLLGSGGAARAIAFTLAAEANAKDVVILNRTKGKAVLLADEISKASGTRVRAGGLGGASKEIPSADVVINCTSVGLKSDESAIPKELLSGRPAVFDVVFNPLHTRLLRDAESMGCPIVTGDGMLLHQGAKAFEIWTGKKPDLVAMRAALHRALSPSVRP